MLKTIDVPLLHLLAFSTRCAEFTSFDLVRFSLSLAAVEKSINQGFFISFFIINFDSTRESFYTIKT